MKRKNRPDLGIPALLQVPKMGLALCMKQWLKSKLHLPEGSGGSLRGERGSGSRRGVTRVCELQKAILIATIFWLLPFLSS